MIFLLLQFFFIYEPRQHITSSCMDLIRDEYFQSQAQLKFFEEMS